MKRQANRQRQIDSERKTKRSRGGGRVQRVRDRQTDRRQTDRQQTDGGAERERERERDRQTDRQTDREGEGEKEGEV